MKYEVFQDKVNALIRRAGGGITVQFSQDSDFGTHYARCSDGTVIIGNESRAKVTVNWGGRNHSGMVRI